MADYKFGIVIGKFHPFHHGHMELIKEGLSISDTLIIGIGSAGKAANIQNPWSEHQRKEMILSALSDEQKSRIKFIFIKDSYYTNNKWLADVQSLVAEATDNCDDSQICNIGEISDFPQWKFFKMRSLDRLLRGSAIRGLYFTHDAAYKGHVPESVAQYLEEFKLTETFKNLKEEYEYIRNYKRQWEGAPFDPTFVCTDAILIKSGHILVIRRKGNPGKGLLALPGGFLNPKETIVQGCIRELKEETSIKVSKEDLEKAIVTNKVFDYPGRSLRGRTITNVFLFDLGYGPLPQIKAGDDAAGAQWISLAEFTEKESEFFEDHWHIVSSLIYRF